MQNTKRTGRTEPEPLDPGVVDYTDDADDVDDGEGFEIRHAICPDCGQSIALVADEEYLPEHALCPSPWNPFGLTVCAGTGRPAADALPAVDEGADTQELEVVMLTLPQGLDWRTQPFSHVGGPGSRPVRLAATVPLQRSRHAQAA
ncbi:hypothetical protein ACFVGY_27345 [Streptomyces sp. NPDC127106]|uniref:hypothetical protein n=1 Tax=Streptomyces sp. NPDC127106 TaxID=3345360 RepID=UPI0036410353